MGAIWSYFFGDLDTVDPATGLTQRQKNAIKNSWDLVAEDAKGNGIVFYMRLFDEYPDYQKLFPKGISNKTKEELPGSIRMKAQAAKTMMALNNYVANLNDPAVLVVMLKDLARSHLAFGVGKEHFTNVKSPLMWALETALGAERFNEFTQNAWSSVIDVIISVVCQTVDDIEAGKESDE
ncbi:globin-like [Tubulanus polymorphus]|uniref:globin-like n=1 Tax=Tubulanus polymorphus TaxID=672921 RepID=UPI003DA2D9DD